MCKAFDVITENNPTRKDLPTLPKFYIYLFLHIYKW